MTCEWFNTQQLSIPNKPPKGKDNHIIYQFKALNIQEISTNCNNNIFFFRHIYLQQKLSSSYRENMYIPAPQHTFFFLT